MIGRFLESLSDEQLRRVADATQWCAFVWSDGDAGCLLTNAGIGRGAPGTWLYAFRFDELIARYMGAPLVIDVYCDGRDGRRRFWRNTAHMEPRPPFAHHVEKLRTMIQNRARKILATRTLAQHPPTRSAFVSVCTDSGGKEMRIWKMDAVHVRRRQKWVDALLSGEYGQAVGALRRYDAFCCLGVACDISKLGKWRVDGFGEGDYLKGGGTLPFKVQEWLGVEDDNPNLCNHSAAEINDGGASFEEVAMAILFEEEYQRTDADDNEADDDEWGF